METFLNIPVHQFADKNAWNAWLQDNYREQAGLWIKISKKASGIPSVTHIEALDEALCYGWIDGQRRGYDENYFLQKFTPRRKRSLWSKVNIGKVEALVVTGRMQAPGLAEIELAKADGRWEAAYESQATAMVPDDLVAAFEQNPKAKEFFESLTKAERYSVLWKLMTASNPQTRTKRLHSILEKLSTQHKI